MRRMLILVAVLFFSAATFAQAPEQTVTWSTSVSALKDGLLEVRFTGKILDGWHTYSLRDGIEDGFLAPFKVVNVTTLDSADEEPGDEPPESEE